MKSLLGHEKKIIYIITLLHVISCVSENNSITKDSFLANNWDMDQSSWDGCTMSYRFGSSCYMAQMKSL